MTIDLPASHCAIARTLLGGSEPDCCGSDRCSEQEVGQAHSRWSVDSRELTAQSYQRLAKEELSLLGAMWQDSDELDIDVVDGQSLAAHGYRNYCSDYVHYGGHEVNEQKSSDCLVGHAVLLSAAGSA